MRDLKRNQRLIHYSLLNVTVTDGWGNESKTYSEIQSMHIAVSSEKGDAAAEAFGKDLDYDVTAVTHDMSCPIDEYSHVWIDAPTDAPYDYEVKRKATSLNCIAYALKRVTVS